MRSKIRHESNARCRHLNLGEVESYQMESYQTRE